MKKAILFFYCFTVAGALCAQCPFSVSLSGSAQNCLGTTLNIVTPNTAVLQKITWVKDNTPVQTNEAFSTSGTGITIAGLDGRGANANQLNNPIAIFVDAGGNVYIVDRLNYRVQRWAPGAVAGSTVAGGNGQGSGAAQLTDPIGLFVDAAANIYIADYGNNRVQKWTPGATTGTTVAGGNGPGTAANQLTSPTGVFVDASGNVFVADAGNDRIQKWPPGALSGTTVAGGNGGGSLASQLRYPTGVVGDADGNLFIADELNDRIQKWPPGAASGTTVAGGNGAGSAPSQFTLPYSVYVDENDNLFIADLVNDRIQEWPPGAAKGITVAGAATGGTAANQLLAPQSVFVDTHGAIYIADYGNNRVQKWAAQTHINTTFTPLASGDYKAMITGIDGCTITSNTLTIYPSVASGIRIIASDTAVCEGTAVTFTATDSNGTAGASWQWQVNGIDVTSRTAAFSSSTLADGDVVTCVFNANAVCALPSQTISNAITMAIKPALPANVSIISSANIICSGDSVIFTASPANGLTKPDYQWQLNGVNIGDGSSNNTFISSTLTDADVVTCMLSASNTCLSATSNSVTLTVKDTPHIDSIPALSISPGQQVQIDPQVSGNVHTYSWQPPEGLSNAAIRNPVAAPLSTTVYTLLAEATSGCAAKATVTIEVIRPLKIPGAFTPNGDSKNDIFYILGTPGQSRISAFLIYDRWGREVFAVHNVMPGDPSSGWNGRINNDPAPAGTYVYVAVVALANNGQQVYKGSFVLVR